MSRERPWRDEDTLEEAYSRHHSIRKVAEEFGCGKETVRNWMIKFGMERTGRQSSVALSERSDGYEQFVVNVDGKSVSVLHHRLLAVAKYGYDSVVGNDVHHTNSMKLDNRLDNIEVLGHDEHARVHYRDRIINEAGQLTPVA